MCEPTTIMLAVSAVAGLVAQNQAAKGQDQYNKQQARNSAQAQRDNWEQINTRRSQEAEAAAEKIAENNTAMREAQATQIASAGPGGLSMDALLGHIAQKGASYNDSVNANYQRINQGLDSQLTNVNRNAASEVNSLKAPAKVDYLGAALKIGNAAYTGYQKTTQ
jgi:uncharacterized protein HemX